MAVVRFPKLSELQEALADLVAEDASEMPVPAAVTHIIKQHELGAIEEHMNVDTWVRYVIRKMDRLDPNRTRFKPTVTDADLFALAGGKVEKLEK